MDKENIKCGKLCAQLFAVWTPEGTPERSAFLNSNGGSDIILRIMLALMFLFTALVLFTMPEAIPFGVLLLLSIGYIYSPKKCWWVLYLWALVFLVAAGTGLYFTLFGSAPKYLSSRLIGVCLYLGVIGVLVGFIRGAFKKKEEDKPEEIPDSELCKTIGEMEALHPELERYKTDSGDTVTIKFKKINPDGFEITLTVDQWYAGIETDAGWHTFDDSSDGLINMSVLVRDLLSRRMRIKETLTNAQPYKWETEVRDGEIWRRSESIGLMFWWYFGKRSERIFQNNILPPREMKMYGR